MPEKTIEINNLRKATRLDRVLRDALPSTGRNAINQLIQDRQVKVNGKTVWLNSWKINNGDTLFLLSVPDTLPETVASFDDSWIIADDGDVIALNKPAGLLSQETKYGKQPNLLTMAEARFGKVILFHRLDRDTSGVILLTRGGAINRYLDTAFKAKTIVKQYVALVSAPNRLSQEGRIELRLDSQSKKSNRMQVVERGGKLAITDYRVEKTGDKQQLVYLTPKTGRTHQLRVHLAHYDAPIAGDRIYSPDAKKYERLYLHAHQITLPESDDFPERSYTASIPEVFQI